MTKWFGPPWPRADFRAPVCEDDADQIPTPVGSPCALCDQTIRPGDNGVALPFFDAGHHRLLYHHRECFLRHIVGCSASLRGEPHNHGGDYREDALRVEDWLAGNPGW